MTWKDYWYSSTHHKDKLTGKLHNDNQNPCRPNFISCHCGLEKRIAEQELSEMSFFTYEDENLVGNLVLENLQGNPNLNSDFSVGKYNFANENYNNMISFCGEFAEEKEGSSYFTGVIQDDSILQFGLDDKLPKLCAISDDAKIFEYK